MVSGLMVSCFRVNGFMFHGFMVSDIDLISRAGRSLLLNVFLRLKQQTLGVRLAAAGSVSFEGCVYI